MVVGCWLLVVGCGGDDDHDDGGGGGGGGGASLQNGNYRAGSLGNLEEFPIGRFGLKKGADKKHKTPSTQHLIYICLAETFFSPGSALEKRLLERNHPRHFSCGNYMTIDFSGILAASIHQFLFVFFFASALNLISCIHTYTG